MLFTALEHLNRGGEQYGIKSIIIASVVVAAVGLIIAVLLSVAAKGFSR